MKSATSPKPKKTAAAMPDFERGQKAGRAWSRRGPSFERFRVLARFNPADVERRDPLRRAVDLVAGANPSRPKTSLWFDGKKLKQPTDAHVEGFLAAIREAWDTLKLQE